MAKKVFFLLFLSLITMAIASLFLFSGGNFPSFLLAQRVPPGGPPVGVPGGPAGWTDDGAVVRLTNSADRVGIGTAAPDPSAKLDVIGNINLSGLIDGIDLSIKALDWDTAFNERNRWDGGSAGLNAATGRTSLGLGSLAVLNSVSGGIGGTISDGTVADADLAVLNRILLKDTDGIGCHRLNC
jgi:hypothetical protein